MSTQQKFENRIEALNTPVIELSDESGVIKGWKKITEQIIDAAIEKIKNKRYKTAIVAFDGYVGTDWDKIIHYLKKEETVEINAFDVGTCLKSKSERDKMLRPYLGDDPVFGKIYNKSLKTLFDSSALQKLKKQILDAKRKQTNGKQKLIIVYGSGAAMNPMRKIADLIIYFDLTRQESLTRNKKWSNLAGKTQSIGPKKLYYIDFQVNDKHRNQLLKKLDFYVDGNQSENPVMLSGVDLVNITDSLANYPFRLKPIYEPGPWGGQWLKGVRDLPDEWVNCAWSFEVIAQEQSLLLAVNDSIIELPWTTFFQLEYDKIMGDVPKHRFVGQFPIRYDYLDTMDGGDLSVQVHPPTPYIREHFNEPYHQGEMYYLVEVKPGALVNLGLNENTKQEEFYQAAKLADEEGAPFDYRKFVNSVPSKKHALLMIPPGTVHGSGEGQVVLEISATTYRYTFKIYDHLRPDLNGVMRPIHVEHAFNVIKWFRRKNWVQKNLLQEPKLVRSGSDWQEYLISDRREFFHVVFRLDFETEIEDDTAGKFHVLTLTAGQSVLLQSVSDARKRFHLKYSETVIVPACFGKYKITNLGENPCKIAKARLR